jgi:hypothetical protein
MIHNSQMISCLSALGEEFRKASVPDLALDSPLARAAELGYMQNPWFLPQFTRFSFAAWAEALREDKVRKWLGMYDYGKKRSKGPATVGLIMAGNIPMVGLHDLLCILASGNNALVKYSASDNQLIPAVTDLLASLNPELEGRVSISDGPLKNFDAIIATGSNNSSRYFEYYFSKYPSIIRKNRNGVAVVTGNETGEEIRKLADDIFMYSGLGCRNVSKIYLPESFTKESLFEFFSGYGFLQNNHKYMNNYDYQKSLLLINRVPHLDNGFLLLKEDNALITPVSVLNAETYMNIEMLRNQLILQQDQIQCTVTNNPLFENAVPFGRSQFPELWDYADGVDTMSFLVNL